MIERQKGRNVEKRNAFLTANIILASAIKSREQRFANEEVDGEGLMCAGDA